MTRKRENERAKERPDGSERGIKRRSDRRLLLERKTSLVKTREKNRQFDSFIDNQADTQRGYRGKKKPQRLKKQKLRGRDRHKQRINIRKHEKSDI